MTARDADVNLRSLPTLEGVQDLLRSGKQKEARAGLDDLPSAQSQSLRGRMTDIRLRLAEGNPSLAMQLADEHLSDHASANSWVWLLHLETLCADGQIDMARERFLDGLGQGHSENEQVILSAIDTLLVKTTGHAGKLTFLEETHARAPDLRVIQLRLATRYMLGGQPHKALNMLAKAEATGPLPAFAERTKTMLYPFVGGYSEAFDRLKAECDSGPVTSIHLRRMSRYASAAHRHDEAFQALQNALRDFPEDWLVLYRLGRTILTPDQRRCVFDQLDALQDSKSDDPAWMLQLGVLALQASDTGKGRLALEDVDSASAVGWTARALLGALTAVESTGQSLEQIDDRSEIVEIRHPNAIGTIVLFTNLTGGLELLPISYLDRLLSDLPLNRIYLRDHSGLMFQNGIRTCGVGDAPLHEHLRDLTAQLGVPVLTIGNSFGANAAIRAALAIQGAKALSFAGVFDLSGNLDDGDTLHSQGAWEMKNAGPLVNLVPLLQARPDLQVTHVYGAKFAPDVKRAKPVEALENCAPVILPDVGHHYAGLESIAQGLFRRLVQDQFGL